MQVKKISAFGIGIVVVILLSIFKSTESSIVTRNKNIYAVGIDENIIYHDIKKEYGITLDSFKVVQNRIRRNYNLARLLSEAGLESDLVNKATFRASEVFNIRNIKAGNNYKLYYTKDSSETLKYFVYVHSPVDYLKISLKDQPRAIKGEKQVTIIRKTSTGKVSSSLWETMLENNIDPLMAIRLSEIYAWTVDFFGLEEGDEFKVVYDEQYVDSVPIGIGEIHAASFIHRGEQMQAYSYEQDGEKSFFDENGKSLRREFLKAPLRFSRISSGYSNSRMHPILKIRRPHRGVDYAAPTGTPIYSIGDGTIVGKGYTKAAGYYVKVKHNSVYTTGYNHLSKYPRGIKIGQRVTQGQIIGYVGSTGYATGPHLDFRMWKNGYAVNPLQVKAPPVKPIPEEELSVYQSAISKLKQELVSIDS